VKTLLLLIKAFWVGTKPLSSLVNRLGFGRSKRKRSRVVMVILTLLMLLLAAYFLVMLGFTYWGYQTFGMLVDKPYLGLFLAMVVGCVATVIFSFTSIANVLYSAGDVRMLSALPIAHHTLALSRLAILYLLYAPLYAFMTLPAVVVAAWIGSLNPTFVIASLINVVIAPVVPLAIVTIAIALAIRLNVAKRAGSASKIVAMLLFLLFFIALSALMTRSLDTSGALAYDYQAMVTSMLPLFATLERIFSALVVQAKGYLSLPSLLLSLLLPIALGTLAIVAVIETYGQNLLRLASGSPHRRSQAVAGGRQRSLLGALVRREAVVIKSHSAFIFEVVGELFIPLILIGVWAITGTIGEMASLLEGVLSLPVVGEVIFLILAMVANMTMISSTSVSRQGPHFALDRLYPVEPRRYVDAKLLFHLLLSGSLNLVYLAAALLLLGRGLAPLVWMAPLSLLSIAAVASFQLAIDYHNPNEEWTLAQHAMKSNPNGLFGLLVTLLWIVVAALLLVVLPLLGVGVVLARLLCLCVTALLFFFGHRVAVAQASAALTR
jgi:ABC-2 type transport system permease protein